MFIMKYSTEKIFHCYSPNLREFLENNGMETCIKPFRNSKTNKICWCFEKTPELNILLKEWTDSRQYI